MWRRMMRAWLMSAAVTMAAQGSASLTGTVGLSGDQATSSGDSQDQDALISIADEEPKEGAARKP